MSILKLFKYPVVRVVTTVRNVTQIYPPCPLKGRGKSKQDRAFFSVASKWTNNMDGPRDVQTSKRNGSSSRSLLSAGSAVAMEIKRKKIRQSSLFLPTEVRANLFWAALRFPLSTLDSLTRMGSEVKRY